MEQVPQQQAWQGQHPLPPRRPTGKWYFVITIATVGFLAAVPFFHAASVLRRPALRKVGALYGAGSLLGYVLIGLAPEDELGNATGWSSDVAGILLLAILVAATLQQIGLRREVYGHRSAAGTGAPNATAIGFVEQARTRRADARALAARDPLMARELRIGRPDLPRQYDDGGLVDLNAAPVEAIAGVCQIPASAAATLVETREQLGGFTTVDEAIVYANLDEDAAIGIRERGIVLGKPGS